MTDATHIRTSIDEARSLARQLAHQAPGSVVYEAVLKRFDAIEAAMPRSAQEALHLADSLGVFAVRELDEIGGKLAELANLIYRISYELHRLAGTP